MSDFPSNATASEDSHSETNLSTTNVAKRELNVDDCDDIPSKRFALETTIENSNASFLPTSQLGNDNISSEIEVTGSKFDTSNVIVPDNNTDTVSLDSTTKEETDFKEPEPVNSASSDNLKQESTAEVKDTIKPPEIILKIGTDYASDGELEDSPLPDLPEASPISDKSEMSPITQELLTRTEETDDKNQTHDDGNAKAGNSSDENLYDDLTIPQEELSVDNQFSESGLPGENLADSKPKSDGIELMNFTGKPYFLPETERFGCCRLITEFQKLSIIGEGAFGIVYKVVDTKNNNSLLALKKLKFKSSSEGALPVQVVREINILKTLEHPNIVNSHGVAVGSNFNNTYLILDFCECDLSKIIDDEKSSEMLKESEIKCIMLQLFEGLKYIHFNYVIHRDLTCLNVLFTSRGILKIGDFGSSRYIIPDTPMTPNVVSRWYRAPELLLGETAYTPAVDIWSSGCILAEVHIKRPLLKAKSDMEMIASIIDLLGTPTERIWRGVSQLPVLQNYDLVEQPENRLRFMVKEVSNECFQLLEQLLTYDPKKRITAAEAGYNPWFLMPPTACSPDGLIPILNVVQEIVRLRSR